MARRHKTYSTQKKNNNKRFFKNWKEEEEGKSFPDMLDISGKLNIYCYLVNVDTKTFLTLLITIFYLPFRKKARLWQ